jgi:hypothetical protein
MVIVPWEEKESSSTVINSQKFETVINREAFITANYVAFNDLKEVKIRKIIFLI